jgi:hemerythrin-like metal-binding protein
VPTLNWSDDLNLGVAAMDTTHTEFVDLLAQTEAAADANLLEHWAELVAHTQEHFDNEDRYMVATRFAASNCHSTHHRMVLEVMRQGLSMGQAGDLAPIRQMTRELATWFVQHANSMDAALAAHLNRVGFNPATGHIAKPAALPAEAIQGCGGATCTPEDVAEHAQAAIA